MSKNKGHRYFSRGEWLAVRATTKREPSVFWQSTGPYHIPRGVAGHSHSGGVTYRRKENVT